MPTASRCVFPCFPHSMMLVVVKGVHALCFEVLDSCGLSGLFFYTSHAYIYSCSKPCSRTTRVFVACCVIFESEQGSYLRHGFRTRGAVSLAIRVPPPTVGEVAVWLSGCWPFLPCHLAYGEPRQLSKNSRAFEGSLLGARVGSSGFQKLAGRVGSGPGGVRNLTDRVELGQEVFKCHGSSRVTLTRSDPRDVI